MIQVLNWASKDGSAFHSSALVLMSFKISLAFSSFLLFSFHKLGIRRITPIKQKVMFSSLRVCLGFLTKSS